MAAPIHMDIPHLNILNVNYYSHILPDWIRDFYLKLKNNNWRTFPSAIWLGIDRIFFFLFADSK